MDYPQPTEIIGEFYNLHNDPVDSAFDPYELNNLYVNLTSTELADLRDNVLDYRTCAGDSCRIADSP